MHSKTRRISRFVSRGLSNQDFEDLAVRADAANQDCPAVATDHVCESVRDMVLLQQALPRPFSYELKDPASVLTARVSTDRYTLQDICMCILSWGFQNEWQRRLATDKLIEIIDLLKTLTLSPGAGWASVKNYTEAIYEIAFLILKGIPAGRLKVGSSRGTTRARNRTG